MAGTVVSEGKVKKPEVNRDRVSAIRGRLVASVK
jgi:hypothetical protein